MSKNLDRFLLPNGIENVPLSWLEPGWLPHFDWLTKRVKPNDIYLCAGTQFPRSIERRHQTFGRGMVHYDISDEFLADMQRCLSPERILAAQEALRPNQPRTFQDLHNLLDALYHVIEYRYAKQQGETK